MANIINLWKKATSTNQNNKNKDPTLDYTQLHYVFCSYHGTMDSFETARIL